MQLVPNMTRNQWLWLGGAAVLGVTEVVSAPIALALAALPVLDSIAGDEESSRRARSTSSRDGIGRRSVAGRRTRSRSTGAARRARREAETT